MFAQKNRNKGWDQEKIVNFLIGSFLLLTYVFGLISPVTSDAGKYAAISRIIYETGDWINLSIHHEPYLQKPPLLFWITAPFYHVFGPSEFAFKFPVLLYSALGVYSLFRFARMFYGKKVAGLSALVLVGCEFFFFFHNDIHCDVILTANVIFAVWQMAEYIRSGRLMNVLLTGLGAGLAMISKGPVGLFVFATAVLSHLVYTRNLKVILNFKVLAGILVFLLVLVPGLWGLYRQFGNEGLYFFFWENNAGRIAGRIKGSDVDYSFYFHTTLYMFLPWGLLFFIALFYEFKEVVKKRSAELFTVGGTVFYWVVLSVSHAQAPHYMMVLTPFMAVVTAKWAVRFFGESGFAKTKSAVVVAQYVTMALAWLVLVVLCVYCFPATNVVFWLGVGALAVLFWLGSKTDRLWVIVRRSVISAVALNFAINVHLFPCLFANYQSVIPACEIFNRQAGSGETLSCYRSEHRELFFYAKQPGYFLYDHRDLEKCLKQPGNWIYTNETGLREIEESGAGMEVVSSFKHRSMMRFTGKFMWPSTRERCLKNMYLVKITEPL